LHQISMLTSGNSLLSTEMHLILLECVKYLISPTSIEILSLISILAFFYLVV